MKVRIATKFDLPDIYRMLRSFRNNTPIEFMKDCDNEPYIAKLFTTLLAGAGIVLVACNNEEKVVGIIAGIINSNIWEPEIKALRELIFWVDESSRGSSAGARLIKAYGEVAQQLIEKERIKIYTMTKMINSPDLNFTRYGYRKSEEVWVAGA